MYIHTILFVFSTSDPMFCHSIYNQPGTNSLIAIYMRIRQGGFPPQFRKKFNCVGLYFHLSLNLVLIGSISICIPVN